MFDFQPLQLLLGPDAHDFLGATMQVTIDTRHDTLEEALAVIQLAFARTSEPPPESSAGKWRTGKKTAAKKSRSSTSAQETRASAARRAPAGKKAATSHGDRR